MSDLVEQCPGQGDLFGASYPVPPHNGTETSREAAESVKPTAAQQRERVYGFIAENWPCSDEAIALGLGLDGNSVRPRRWELVKAGRIAQDGHAMTRSNKRAVAWSPADCVSDETAEV